MTISTASPRTSFNCDGVSTVFPVPMQAYLATDFLVILTGPVSAGSIEVTQLLNSDYSLAQAGTLKPTAWTLTSLGAPYPAGYTLQVIVNPVQTQQTQYVQNQAFPSLPVQTNFDRLTQMIQRIQDQVNRTPRAPDGDYAPSMLLPTAIQRALQYMAFDSGGNAVTVPALPGSNISQQSIGVTLYPITPAEALVGVVPVNQYISSDLLDPRRYGAVGDGSSSDLVALTKCIAVINATSNPTATWPLGLTFVTTPLPAITAAHFTWNCYSTLKAAPNTQVGIPLVTISGSFPKVNCFRLDGNHLNQTMPSSCGLKITGTYPLLYGVHVFSVAGWGLMIDTVSGGGMVNCKVTGNDAFGCYLNTVSNFTRVGCDFSGNGYGFQVLAPVANGGVGMGSSTRFRSYNNVDVACTFNLNGIDGSNDNQGSYNHQYLGCVAYGNGDGGFTLASDTTADFPGRVGQGETCYNISHDASCMAYDNWAAGIVYETAVFGCSAKGKYWNNGRGAGTISILASVPAGIYVGNFSAGIDIDAECYDDRQLCPVTGNSAGVLTATGWIPGSATLYPRVSIYNTAQQFQGYGTITAESAGTVTIATTAFNGATVASIASGWYVTQKLQHKGVFFDIGSQGTVKNNGYGCLQGPDLRFGYKVYAYPGNGTNVVNKNVTMSSVELLANPSWDTSIATSWTYAGAGVTTQLTPPGPLVHSPGALQILSGGSVVTGTGALIASGASYCQEAWFEFSCVVTNNVAGFASITLNNVSISTTVTHGGGGTRRLTIGGLFPVGSSPSPVVTCTGGATVQFDESSLKVGFEPFDNRDFSYPVRTPPL